MNREKDYKEYGSIRPDGSFSFVIHSFSPVGFGKYVTRLFERKVRPLQYDINSEMIFSLQERFQEERIDNSTAFLLWNFFHEDYDFSVYSAKECLEHQTSFFKKLYRNDFESPFAFYALNLLRRATQDIKNAKELFPENEDYWDREFDFEYMNFLRRKAYYFLEFSQRRARKLFNLDERIKSALSLSDYESAKKLTIKRERLLDKNKVR